MEKEVKGDARDDRLILRKTNEEVFRKQHNNEARAICKEKFVNFGKCAKDNGILVVLNCRKENQEMTDCMEYNCSEEKFKEFLSKNGIPPSRIQPAKESLWKSLLPK